MDAGIRTSTPIRQALPECLGINRVAEQICLAEPIEDRIGSLARPLRLCPPAGLCSGKIHGEIDGVVACGAEPLLHDVSQVRCRGENQSSAGWQQREAVPSEAGPGCYSKVQAG